MTTQTYRRVRHRVSLLHAHLVFVTRYRRAVFTDEMLTSAENTMGTVCAELDAHLVDFNGETDHVHLLVQYPPSLAISTRVQRLKGRTADAIQREFTARVCPHPHARTPLVAAYFAVSGGGAPLSIIKQYTDGQADHSERRATPGDKRDGLTPD